MKLTPQHLPVRSRVASLPGFRLISAEITAANWDLEKNGGPHPFWDLDLQVRFDVPAAALAAAGVLYSRERLLQSQLVLKVYGSLVLVVFPESNLRSSRPPIWGLDRANGELKVINTGDDPGFSLFQYPGPLSSYLQSAFELEFFGEVSGELSSWACPVPITKGQELLVDLKTLQDEYREKLIEGYKVPHWRDLNPTLAEQLDRSDDEP